MSMVLGYYVLVMGWMKTPDAAIAELWEDVKIK
jgi:hypothetical protein